MNTTPPLGTHLFSQLDRILHFSDEQRAALAQSRLMETLQEAGKRLFEHISISATMSAPYVAWSQQVDHQFTGITGPIQPFLTPSQQERWPEAHQRIYWYFLPWMEAAYASYLLQLMEVEYKHLHLTWDQVIAWAKTERLVPGETVAAIDQRTAREAILTVEQWQHYQVRLAEEKAELRQTVHIPRIRKGHYKDLALTEEQADAYLDLEEDLDQRASADIMQHKATAWDHLQEKHHLFQSILRADQLPAWERRLKEEADQIRQSHLHEAQEAEMTCQRLGAEIDYLMGDVLPWLMHLHHDWHHQLEAEQLTRIDAWRHHREQALRQRLNANRVWYERYYRDLAPPIWRKDRLLVQRELLLPSATPNQRNWQPATSVEGQMLVAAFTEAYNRVSHQWETFRRDMYQEFSPHAQLETPSRDSPFHAKSGWTLYVETDQDLMRTQDIAFVLMLSETVEVYRAFLARLTG